MKKYQIFSSEKINKITFASLFILLLAFALVVRIFYVWNKGFWYDEILTMRFDVPYAGKLYFKQLRFLNDYIIYNLKPYWDNEFIIRLPNILASTLTVAALGLWMKRALGNMQAVVAMLCLAISPCFIQHTCLCRAYGFLAFLVVLNCWAAYEILTRQKIGWYLLFAFSTFGILISRMEGLVIPAALIFLLPFFILLKNNITFKKLFVAAGAITVIACAGWFAGNLIYNKALTLSMSAMGTRPDQISFGVFLMRAFKGIVGELSISNLNFALHHNFRPSSWKILLEIILICGFAYLVKKKIRLAIISMLMIVLGFPMTKWLLMNFYKVPFDSRHMQHATPGFIIIFVAGLFLFLNLSRKIKNVKLRIPAIIISYAILAFGLVFYIKTAGEATVDLVKYNRIADWKQISKLSQKVNDRNIFINGGGRGIEFGYYKSKFSRGNLNTCISKLKSCDKIYYFAGNKKNEVDALSLTNYDVITIPFEPFAVFVIYKNKSNFINYWQRVENELQNALPFAPGHTQIHDGINAARILSGKKSAPVNTKTIKQFNGEKIVLPVKTWKPLYGWGKIEKLNGNKFRWSSGKVSSVVLPAYSGMLKQIILFGMPYFGGKNKTQEITAYLGNENLGTKKITGAWQNIPFNVPINLSLNEKILTLIFGNPIAPYAINRGDDDRMLALGLSEIKLSFWGKINNNILLTGNKSSDAFLGDNWCNPEKWPDGRTYRWIDGTFATALWSGNKNDNFTVWEIEALPFVMNGKKQTMTVMQNNIVLTNLVMMNRWTKYEINAPPLKSGNCKLQLTFDYAIKPASIGMGCDTRRLSAAISKIEHKE